MVFIEPDAWHLRITSLIACGANVAGAACGCIARVDCCNMFGYLNLAADGGVSRLCEG